MADIKVTELDAIAASGINAGADVIPISDVSAEESKKATPSAIVQAALEAGVTLDDDILIDGQNAHSVEFDDVDALTLDAATLNLSGVESVSIASTGSGDGQGKVELRADQALKILTPEVLAGSAATGQLMRLVDPLTGEAEFGDIGDVGSQLAGNSIPSSKLKTTSDSDKVQLANLGNAVIASLAGSLSAADYLGEITSLSQSIPAASGNSGKWYSSTVVGTLTDSDVSTITVASGDRIVSNGTAWLKYAAPPTSIPDASVTRAKLDGEVGVIIDANGPVSDTDEDGNTSPAWGVVDLVTGKYTLIVNADGTVTTSRDPDSEIAVRSDIPADLEEHSTSNLMSDGTTPPPWFVADKLTGTLITWVDATGKLRVPNGEVATKPASGVDPIQEIDDDLEHLSVISEDGLEPLSLKDGVLSVGELRNESDPGMVYVEIDPVSSGREMRVTHRSAKFWSTAWIQYTWTRYASAPSTGTWYLSSICKIRRPTCTTRDWSRVAVGTAVLSAGGLASITVTSSGRGYSTAPTVTIASETGTGATATATIDSQGAVTGFTVTAAGSGYSAASVLISESTTTPLVYGGFNDIVFIESSSGGASIDYPAQTVSETFIGAGHGAEYAAGLDAVSPVENPVAMLDGAEIDTTVAGRYSGREFRMLLRSDLYRNRASVQGPGTATPWGSQVKEWVVKDGALSVLWNVQFDEQFTGACYAPLYCFRVTYTTLYRDSDMIRARIPTDYDSAAVANNVAGVTRVILQSPTDGSVILETSDLAMWADGDRPHGAKITPGLDELFVKTDPDLNKVYMTIGSTVVGSGGGSSPYRAAAGERWHRKYNLKFLC